MSGWVPGSTANLLKVSQKHRATDARPYLYSKWLALRFADALAFDQMTYIADRQLKREVNGREHLRGEYPPLSKKCISARPNAMIIGLRSLPSSHTSHKAESTRGLYNKY